MYKHISNQLIKIDKIFSLVETTFLVILITSSVLGAMTQIILRNFADTALPFMEIILRRSVLWITLLGASLATRQQKHLSVDLLNQILPTHLVNKTTIITNLISSAITGILCYSAIRFIIVEIKFTGFSEVYSAVIMPICFSIMSLRFILNATRHTPTNQTY